MRASIEDFGDTLEGLLTGRVPNLELEGRLLQLDYERAELDANRDLVVFQELIRGDPLHEAALAHGAVADDDQLEQEVGLVEFGVEEVVRHRVQLCQSVV